MTAPSLHAEVPQEIAFAIEPVTRPAPERKETVISIVLVGDTGFNGDRQPVHADGAHRHGTRYGWDDVLSRIRGEIVGDLAFANLETVVTARNDLRIEDRTFAFRSHPNGVRALARAGFNLISTANNHAYDLGPAGALETLAALDDLTGEGLIKAHAGLARSREAATRPALAEVKGARVALAAIGIGAGGYGSARGSARPGQLSYNSQDDFAAALEGLAAAAADYRILSVHYGIERVVTPSPEAIRKLRGEALLRSGIDLVAGHHSHVAAGLEITDGRLIVYGLGNFLHQGMQSSAGLGICKDFGLLVRVHLLRGAEGRLVLRAIEAVTLAEMHLRPERMPPERGRDRIGVLNYLSQRLDDPASGARGVRLTARDDGTGIYCAPGAEADPAPIGALCRQLPEAQPIPPLLRQRIASSCGGGGELIAGGEREPRRTGQRIPGRLVRATAREAVAAFNPFSGGGQ